jgi:nucleoside-diphosphate-sugar epimerase
MSTLVTGGSGFLGRHLVRHLVENENDSIVVLDDNICDGLYDPNGRTTIIPGDVRDVSVLADVVARHDVTRIVHLAYVLETPEQGLHHQIATNVMGTTNVFEAARLNGVSRVVYMSSAYVYPHRRALSGYAYSESDAPSPDGIYGATKVFNELVAEEYAKTYGLDPIGLRFTAVFGSGRSQREGIAPDDLNVLPELALSGKPIVMPPNDQMSDWMYVADAVEVIRLALGIDSVKHRIFNVASECRPAREFTEILRSLLPDADITVADDPVVMTSLMRTERLRYELGFTPRYALEEGIAAYLASVRGNVV